VVVGAEDGNTLSIKPRGWIHAPFLERLPDFLNEAVVIAIVAILLLLHTKKTTMTEASAAKMDIDNNDDKPTIKVNKRQASVPEESIQMPWVEKYRPAKLEDLVAHEDIVSILTRLIDNDNLPHLLLYGPPGTGKVRK